MNLFTVIRRIFVPDAVDGADAVGQLGKDPAKRNTPEEQWAQHALDQQALIHDVKIAAIALGVLLVLTLEYTPMVVADYQLEDQYADQVRSLVRVEGYATGLYEVVADGSGAWKARVNEHVDRALRRVDQLDRYAYALSLPKSPTPAIPEFLLNCSALDTDIRAWVASAADIESQWRDIVMRCILEPMGEEFDRDGHDQFRSQLLDVAENTEAAVGQARLEFPQPAAPVSTVSAAVLETPEAEAAVGTPAAEKPEELALQGLDKVAQEVGIVAHVVRLGPYAVLPAPRTWIKEYGSSPGSLRSFRDNLLLAHTRPFGAQPFTPTLAQPDPCTKATQRSSSAGRRRLVPQGILPSNQSDFCASDVQVQIVPVIPLRLPVPISPVEISVQEASLQLEQALDMVMTSQEQLQTEMANRTSEIQSAIPALLQPVLAVARPKYLVLGYPIALTLASAYLLVGYTRLWRSARRLGVDRRDALSPLFFAVLAGVPVLVLLGMFWAYDWPQFAQSWWQWTHRGPLIVLVLVVIGCLLFLRSPARRDYKDPLG